MCIFKCSRISWIEIIILGFIYRVNKKKYEKWYEKKTERAEFYIYWYVSMDFILDKYKNWWLVSGKDSYDIRLKSLKCMEEYIVKSEIMYANRGLQL